MFGKKLKKAKRVQPAGGSRRVLITGGASGLGLEIAKEHLRKRDEVIITDLHESAPEALGELNWLPGQWSYRKLNVTKDEDWEAAAAEIDNLDFFYSNAGLAVGGRMANTSVELWQRTIEINVLGSVRGLRLFIPKLNPGARIALTASVCGLAFGPAMPVYNCTKAATVALAESLDAELRPLGISASAICPQFFKSALVNSLAGDDEKVSEIARMLMTGTWLTAPIVARRAVRGVESRRVIITPDLVAAFGWYSKRYARPVHLLLMRGIGWAVARRIGTKR